eukprot:4058333-Pyramimonas_sp.AAC.1
MRGRARLGRGLSSSTWRGFNSSPPRPPKHFGLYTERGSGRGWVARFSPGTDAKETGRRRRTFLFVPEPDLGCGWVAGWVEGGSR